MLVSILSLKASKHLFKPIIKGSQRVLIQPEKKIILNPPIRSRRIDDVSTALIFVGRFLVVNLAQTQNYLRVQQKTR